MFVGKSIPADTLQLSVFITAMHAGQTLKSCVQHLWNLLLCLEKLERRTGMCEAKAEFSWHGHGLSQLGAGPVVVITAGIIKGYKGLSSAFFL